MSDSPLAPSQFRRTFLLMFSGPLIWSVHFLAVYILAALACARDFAGVELAGVGLVQWATAILTLTGIGSVAAVLLSHRHCHESAAAFQRWMTVALCLLSALGMLWVAAPVYLVPMCK